jgi:hypothetical protein
MPESTEHGMRGTAKKEHENVDTHWKLARRICRDSLASPDEFVKLKYF